MDAIDPHEMARVLNIPLFRPSFFMPRYPDGEWGNWRIRHMGLGFSHGYYTSHWLVADTPVLMRRHPEDAESWETWMSLTPNELESQEAGCAFAQGYVAIMGLGMGWIALNAALNPAVERVTVVELDSDVIEFFSVTGIVQQVAPEIGEKIEIVQGDALSWQPQRRVDFLFADIWRTLDEPETLAQVHAMQRNVQAEVVYFWGQELLLYAAFKHMYGPEAPLSREGLNACIREKIKLPLLLPQDEEYAQRIAATVENRRGRGLVAPSVPRLIP